MTQAQELDLPLLDLSMHSKVTLLRRVLPALPKMTILGLHSSRSMKITSMAYRASETLARRVCPIHLKAHATFLSALDYNSMMPGLAPSMIEGVMSLPAIG